MKTKSWLDLTAQYIEASPKLHLNHKASHRQYFTIIYIVSKNSHNRGKLCCPSSFKSRTLN